MPNFGLLLPAASVATLVRLRAVCEWHDLSTCHAFLTAVGHNRRDVVQRLCTPRTSGGCGLSLAAMPRRRGILPPSLRLAASPCALLWRALMQGVQNRQYQATWLGPDFDPDELVYEGSRGRFRIRSKHVWWR